MSTERIQTALRVNKCNYQKSPEETREQILLSRAPLQLHFPTTHGAISNSPTTSYSPGNMYSSGILGFLTDEIIKLFFILLTLKRSQANCSYIYKQFCCNCKEITIECTSYHPVFQKPNNFSKSPKVISLQDYSEWGKKKSSLRNLISNLISKFTMFMPFPRLHSKTQNQRKQPGAQ